MPALFTLALLAIIHFSLFPWHFNAVDFARRLPWFGITRPNDWNDVIINLAFYLPPALIGQWAFQKPKTKLRTLALILTGLTLLSFSLETLQLSIPGRYGNLRDVLCNALGALTGALLAFAIPLPAAFSHSRKFAPQISALTLFLIAFTTWQSFPFLPRLSLYRFLHAADPLLHPTFTLTEMADVFFAILVIYLAALHLRLPALPIALLAALLLPAQALLVDFTISLPRLAAATLALLTASLLFRHPTRLHCLSLATLLTLWILLRQLTPGDFAAPPIHSFTWLPFGTLVEVQRAGSLRLLSNKLLLYAAAIWLWQRTGLPTPLATLAILLLLGITETLQIYLPTRTPESTDLALALLAAFLLSSTPHPPKQNEHTSHPSGN